MICFLSRDPLNHKKSFLRLQGNGRNADWSPNGKNKPRRSCAGLSHKNDRVILFCVEPLWYSDTEEYRITL